MEGQKGYVTYIDNEEIDNESKSKESRAFKLFSEGRSPVEVVIALDREFCELNGMYGLVQIYDEAKYDLSNLLRLHEIVNDLGMGEQEIINALNLANSNDLPYLQSKVDYLRNQQNILTNKIDELKGSWPRLIELALMQCSLQKTGQLLQILLEQ